LELLKAYRYVEDNVYLGVCRILNLILESFLGLYEIFFLN